MLKEDYLGQVRSAAVFMGEAKHDDGAVLGVSRPYHLVSKRVRLQRFPTGAALVVEAELRDGRERLPWFPPTIGYSWRGTGSKISSGAPLKKS